MSRSLPIVIILVLAAAASGPAQEQDEPGRALLATAGLIAGQAPGARRTAIEGRLDELGIAYERMPLVHAKLKGTNLEIALGGGEGPALVLAAHHDVRLGSAGANDDAAGCAVLIELARRLAARERLARPVRILFLDGSQKGLLGAAAWCEARAELAVDRVLVLDLCGRGDRAVVGAGGRPFANTAPGLVPGAEVLDGDLPTDHKAFVTAGLEASFLALFPENEIEMLRARYGRRDLRAPLPATMTEALRGRDEAKDLDPKALLRALELAEAAVDRAAAEPRVGARPRPDFTKEVQELDRALAAGDFAAAGKLAELLGPTGFLEALARPAAEEKAAGTRAATALRLSAGDELRALVTAILADPRAAAPAALRLRGRILFSAGHFRLQPGE